SSSPRHVRIRDLRTGIGSDARAGAVRRIVAQEDEAAARPTLGDRAEVVGGVLPELDAGVCGTVDAHRVSLPIVGDRADQPALPEGACQLAAPEGGGIEGRGEALVRDPRPVRDRRYQELIATDLTSVVRSATPGEDPDGAVEVDRAALRRVGQEGVMAI